MIAQVVRQRDYFILAEAHSVRPTHDRSARFYVVPMGLKEVMGTPDGDLSRLGEGDLLGQRLQRRGRARLLFSLATARRTAGPAARNTGKAGVIHSEILQPEGTAERGQDRTTL